MTHTYNPVSIQQAYNAKKGDIQATCTAVDVNIDSGVRQDGKPWRRRNVTFQDASGSVTGVCWDKWIDLVEQGGTYAISNPQWKDFKNQRVVSLSFYCGVQRIDGPNAGAGAPPPAAAGGGQQQLPQQPPPGFTPMGQQPQQPQQQSPPPPPPPQQGWQTTTDPGMPAPTEGAPTAPPQEPWSEPEPDVGPGDKNVIERVKMLYGFERDIVRELWELDGKMPSAPRVGMYLKIMHDEYARKGWRRGKTNGNGRAKKGSNTPEEGETQ